jgi:hypothetical protein
MDKTLAAHVRDKIYADVPAVNPQTANTNNNTSMHQDFAMSAPHKTACWMLPSIKPNK